MDLFINGQPRTFSNLAAGATLQELLTALGLKPDRIAVEHNGSIVSRPAWPSTPIANGDKFEIVHFVGGGAPCALSAFLCGHRPHPYPGVHSAPRFPVAPAPSRVYSQSR